MTFEKSIPDISRSHVSVALCTCNGARFLGEQLQSIAVQNTLPDELVICDDASTDASISLIEDFARTTSFEVKIFRNENRLGPAKNFEKAVRLCEGEIIFLCDQDDVWKPFKVELMLDALRRNPEALYAFSDAEMMDESGTLLSETLWHAVGLTPSIATFSGRRQLEMLLRQNFVTGATMAIRSSFRDAVLPIANGWMHDYWMVMLASAVSSGVPVPTPLLTYRRHASQVCGWRKKTFWQVCMESLNARAEDWTEKVDSFAKLLERVASMSGERQCPPDRMELLQEKYLHLMNRSGTRASRGLRRLSRVLGEASTGRYQRFSDSWYSIVRDL